VECVSLQRLTLGDIQRARKRPIRFFVEQGWLPPKGQLPPGAVVVEPWMPEACFTRRPEGLNRPLDKARVPPDALVGVCALASALNVSRWTIRRWRVAGYEFQFGRRTSVEHCRQWLEKNAHRTAGRTDRSEVEKRLREIKGTASGFAKARPKRR
jgi:hypothetical protein